MPMPTMQRFDPLNPASYFTGGYKNKGFEDFNLKDPVYVDPSIKYIRERKPLLAGMLMAATGPGVVPAYYHPQASPAIGAASGAATYGSIGAILAALKVAKMTKGKAAILGALLGGTYGYGAGSLARSIYRRHNPELIEAQEKGIPHKVVK